MYFDIHSHILPCVDDGPKDMDEALMVLKSMKEEGITSVIATPHFYPNEMSLGDFIEARDDAYRLLISNTNSLPKIYLGSEILYFKRMGSSRELDILSLNNSKYILLELSDCHIDKYLFEDFELFEENGVVPIIAHIERYYKNRNFKKLLLKIKEYGYPVQINSASVFKRKYKKILKKIFDLDLFCVLATDAHSVEKRPPIMKLPFEEIKKNFSEEIANRLAVNCQTLYKEIIGDSIDQ